MTVLRWPRVDEVLYTALWASDVFLRPGISNMGLDFSGWMYRKGYSRELRRLEERQFIHLRRPGGLERLTELTRSGLEYTLGTPPPPDLWGRAWDGTWRMVLFDVPCERNYLRDKIRRILKARKFGCLQLSTWISPDPLDGLTRAIEGTEADPAHLFFLETRPTERDNNHDLVRAAWDWEVIHNTYASLISHLERAPKAPYDTENALRFWLRTEYSLWQECVRVDPFLPRSLHPKHYTGVKAWELKLRTLPKVLSRLCKKPKTA